MLSKVFVQLISHLYQHDVKVAVFPHLFGFFLFSVLGLDQGGLHLEPLHQLFFVKGFFETGSHELFAWADFELLILLISAP
jgi:hypothetical protein